jgi:DNA-binding NarL/FixJ family response regulator
VRAVLKVFLLIEGATGAAFVFNTSRKSFTDADRGTLLRPLPCLVQLQRNAHSRNSDPALTESPTENHGKLLRLTPRERVVLVRAAMGETDSVIA